MSKHTDTPPTRARLRGMLLIEAMYPRLAPDIMDSYRERSLNDRLRMAAIVAHFARVGGPLRLPLDLGILDAVNIVVKKGRSDVDDTTTHTPDEELDRATKAEYMQLVLDAMQARAEEDRG